jgi:hypothetical protein
MKALRLIIALGLALSIPVAFGQDEEDHSNHHPAQKTDAEGAQPSGDDNAAKSAPVQENMKKIELLMQQIQGADDAAQKRQFLTEHLQALRDQMRLIRSQHTAMKMSMNEDGKGEDGKKEDGAKQGMMKKAGMMGGMMMMHKTDEQRLDILERLMQQVIEGEAAQQSVEQR